MIIKENINDYNLKDHSTCKNLAIVLHENLKREEKNSASLLGSVEQLNKIINNLKENK